MRRIFGARKKKPEAPKAASLEEMSAKMGTKTTELDKKIAGLDRQVLELKKKMRTSRGAAKARYKKQAMGLLRRRKMYDRQREQYGKQQFNMDNMAFTMDTLKDTQSQVATMKETAAAMKTQFKEIDLDDVEDTMDDLADLMEDAEEIQEIMGRSYGGMDDIDEDELEAELEGLEDELGELDMDDESTPSYLETDSLPAVPAGGIGGIATGEGGSSGGGGGGGGGEKVAVDEMGLPAVPAN